MNRYIIVICAMLSLISCAEKDLDENGIPYTLKIGISTSSEDIDERIRKLAPMQAYLERELGIPVVYHKVNSNAPVIEALKAKKIHIASMSPYPYLIARKKANVEAFTVLGNINGNQLDYYKACIVTNAKSGIKTLEDLKLKAKDLTLCFVDPASSSGHIYPRQFLTKNGLDPETSFKKVIFANGHLQAVMTLHSGKVDVTCIQLDVIHRIQKLDKKIKPEDFNIIWFSEALPSTATCIRKDINKEFRQKVLDAYLNIKKDTAAWGYIKRSRTAAFLGKVNFDTLNYIPVNEAMYDTFESKIANLSNLQLLPE